MDIKKTSVNNGQQLDKILNMETKSSGQNGLAPARETPPSETADRVELSKGYQEINRIKKLAMEMNDIRTERVDQVRRMIESNSYVINPDKIANKMLEELL
jgi:negative regulator of flagellin synthesis FlgM